MSIWSAQFTQPCGLHQYKGVDTSGDAQYSPELDGTPIIFYAHADHTRKEVLDKEGNRVISELSLLTDTCINPLDIVEYDGRSLSVIAVPVIEDIHGNLDHYEAVL